MHRRTLLLALAGLGLSAMPAARAAQWGLSESQASDGVRAALRQAARLATNQLGQRDGFWGDPQVRIPLPSQIRSAQSMLRRVGMSQQLDDLELSINRAAEAAMPAVQTIFLNAVQSITLQDALGIVRGGDRSATEYLQNRTSDQLYALVRPRMAQTLESSGAYRALRPIDQRINNQGGFLGGLIRSRSSGRSLSEQVTDDATRRTLNGVFHYVGEEEAAIRRNPVNRTTDILRRVFG
ncbi:DUF4197 domain-containing protein [Maricaulis parjimensis]|uniref:DUF4197 domain-containing protein n=1 Tax=Maricaulis parjimensis TaxID=144023 RepID=UPI00193A5693|nr:DUF4197 domain-containing protein [Maricaulis parjimensis]